MAGGKGNAWTTVYLKLLFQNVADTTVGSGLPAAVTAGSLYVSLHTSDPGASGSQTTSEAAYTSYARAAVVRSSSGFTVTGQTLTFAANVSFTPGTGGGETCTYFAIGTSSTGAGQILYRGTLTPSIVTGNGITPIIPTGGTGIVES